MLQLLVHLLLPNPGRETLLVCLFSIGAAVLTFAVGSIRWWCVRRWRGKAVWRQARDEYERELREKDQTIAVQAGEIEVLHAAAHVHVAEEIEHAVAQVGR